MLSRIETIGLCLSVISISWVAVMSLTRTPLGTTDESMDDAALHHVDQRLAYLEQYLTRIEKEMQEAEAMKVLVEPTPHRVVSEGLPPWELRAANLEDRLAELERDFVLDSSDHRIQQEIAYGDQHITETGLDTEMMTSAIDRYRELFLSWELPLSHRIEALTLLARFSEAYEFYDEHDPFDDVVVAAVVGAYRESDTHGRIGLLGAVRHIEKPALVPTLLEALADPHSDPLRRSAARALSGFASDPEVRRALQATMESYPDTSASDSAQRILEEWKEPWGK